jgi:hypothetical protein
MLHATLHRRDFGSFVGSFRLNVLFEVVSRMAELQKELASGIDFSADGAARYYEKDESKG